jgi:hypothetical protein
VAKDPIVVAKQIRAQRRTLSRVLRISLPITLVGFAILLAIGSRVSESRATVIALTTVLAFLVSWLSILGLSVLGVRDLRNMLRPGSAAAYDEES